ncbi:hypothetical protein ACM42_04660 [Bradyrhizobium sp. CCBAU 25338]|nr:hypothetical protein [Bradyrhizobium sp. CCBAU 25338]
MVSLSCRPRGRIAQRFSLRLLQSIDAAPRKPALARHVTGRASCGCAIEGALVKEIAAQDS